MTQFISHFFAVSLSFFCVYIMACNSPQAKAPAIAASGAKLGAMSAPSPVSAPVAVSVPVDYTFDTSLRDPFKPTTPTITTTGDDTDCGPLCSFDVSQFRVKGIIWGIAQPTAMIFSPENKPYIVKIGSPIGKNKGKVVSIIKDRIAIVEKYVNYRGEVVTNRVDIELASEGGARK